MEVSEFVRRTLVDIAEGVAESQGEAFDQYGVKVNPYLEPQTVEFDIAVTVTEGKATEGGAKLSVAGIGFGRKTETGASTSSVSRIKFTVPVIFRATRNMQSA